GLVLDTLPLEEYQKHSELFSEDLYQSISLETCVEKRISAGGTGRASVETQIAFVKSFLTEK
ncbi:MAG: argininosuccinate lyase, partial [Clostridia bacterium]|nr:argininosuccinate lyase [Clostridia bacterium]